jgi:pilus assembly protein CpaB
LFEHLQSIRVEAAVRPQTILVTLLALVFGGSAAMGVRQYMQRPASQGEMAKVVIAALNIDRGTLVTSDFVTTREYPKNFVPAGAVLTVEDALDRSAFMTIAKDEPILESKLSPKGHRGMAAQIPKGMRAFTINTPNVASGVAGFVLPGNKVDVLLTVASSNFGTTAGDPTGGGTTTTLLQNIEILAVDQRIEAPAENKVDTKELRSVTLLVTPDEAAKLDLGQNKGTLHLSLRNPEDDKTAVTRPARLSDLRFMQEEAGRPWDERAKGVFQALGAALAQAKAAQPKPEEPKPAVQPEPYRRYIRTLRGGNAESPVMIFEPVRSPSGGG